MVEHLAVNEVVPGSSPGDGVDFSNDYVRSVGSEHYCERNRAQEGVEQTSHSTRANEGDRRVESKS